MHALCLLEYGTITGCKTTLRRDSADFTHFEDAVLGGDAVTVAAMERRPMVLVY